MTTLSVEFKDFQISIDQFQQVVLIIITTIHQVLSLLHCTISNMPVMHGIPRFNLHFSNCTFFPSTVLLPGTLVLFLPIHTLLIPTGPPPISPRKLVFILLGKHIFLNLLFQKSLVSEHLPYYNVYTSASLR